MEWAKPFTSPQMYLPPSEERIVAGKSLSGLDWISLALTFQAEVAN